jgi:hypothetical protein
MGRVKSALEIAMEKAEEIGVLSQEEKEKIRDEEKVLSILKEFYNGKLDSNGLWQQLRGTKPSLLLMAQINLIETLSLGSLPEELQTKGQGILAIETLKESPRTSVIEPVLHEIEDLQREYEEMKVKVREDLKKQIEMNPQLRMQPVRTPDGKTVMQMSVSVDEAVNARLAEYLSKHEEEYREEFMRMLEELKKYV